MVKICSIVGIRPQYIKMSKIMRILSDDKDIEHVIINTGQHYDYKMAQQFFKQLKIPDANYNIEVGSGTHAEQISKSMTGIEKILEKEKPDLTLIIGDANPTLAGALISTRLHIPVAHIEAGVRSKNLEMAEEVNRIVADHCSTFLFAPTQDAYNNLLNEGITKEKIFLTGDVTCDIVNDSIKTADESNIIKNLKLTKKDFILLTLHRAESVDNKESLEKILTGLQNYQNIIFPIHPRTKKMIDEFNLGHLTKNMILIDPVGYFDMLYLLKNSKLCATDSGGLVKEAFLLKIPCVTLRNETEWNETVKFGGNIVTGVDSNNISRSIAEMLRKNITYDTNPFGDVGASEKILKIIKGSYSI